MKQKILDLIAQHKLSKQECNMMIEELNKVDISKISSNELSHLQHLKFRIIEEASWRGIFINQLEAII